MGSTSMSTTSTNRVIALIDMDCFYVQVEERDDPSIKGVPAAVVQYKAYKGGGIIAVNYEARAKGVSRNIRGDDAKALCPEIRLVRVPETRGKADLTKYRNAGKEVINVLTEFGACVERASIDEAYIDLTEVVEARAAEIATGANFSSWGESICESLDMECFSTNYVLGSETTQDWLSQLKESELPSMDDIKLAIGAEIVGKMREAVYKKTDFRCSAGIAHNKVVAKLVCGINKPNKQTMLPHSAVPILWSTTKVGKVRGLGGKLGDYVTQALECKTMGDLCKFTEKELSMGLGTRTGSWLYQLCRGFDDEPVTARQLPKSIGCNKNFFGPEALKTKEKVKHWIAQLASEVVERIQRDLEENCRRAKTLTLHVKLEDQNALSRSCGTHPQYNAERMAADAYAVMEKIFQTVGFLPINSLGLIASKFEDEVDISGYGKIDEYFKMKPNEEPKKSRSARERIKEPSSTITTAAASSSKRTISSYFSSNAASSTSSAGICSTVTEDKTPQINDKIITDTSKTREDSSAVTLAQCSSNSFDSNSIGSGDPSTSIVESAPVMRTPTKINHKLNAETDLELDDDARRSYFSFTKMDPKQSPEKSPLKGLPPALGDSSSVSAQGDFTTKCERCGKMIDTFEYASHMDYHYAKDLSREINGMPPIQSNLRQESVKKQDTAAERPKVTLKRPRGKGVASTSGSKRGRPAKSVSTSVSGQSRIDSYFGGGS